MFCIVVWLYSAAFNRTLQRQIISPCTSLIYTVQSLSQSKVKNLKSYFLPSEQRPQQRILVGVF